MGRRSLLGLYGTTVLGLTGTIVVAGLTRLRPPAHVQVQTTQRMASPPSLCSLCTKHATIRRRSGRRTSACCHLNSRVRNRWSVLSTSLLAGSLRYLAVDCCHRPSKLFHTIGNASGVHAVVAARAVRSAASPRRGVVGRPCHRQAPAAVWCRQPGPATAVGCRAAMGVDDRQHALLWRASWR